VTANLQVEARGQILTSIQHGGPFSLKWLSGNRLDAAHSPGSADGIWLALSLFHANSHQEIAFRGMHHHFAIRNGMTSAPARSASR
jgi:hypothetical protein